MTPKLCCKEVLAAGCVSNPLRFELMCWGLFQGPLKPWNFHPVLLALVPAVSVC